MNFDVKFVTEQTPIQTQLTFRAHSVLVDNYTPSYIWLSDAGRFVAPFTQGFVAPLNGCQTADVRWITPPGILVPTPGTGQAQVTFTAEVVTPSSGTQVVIPSQQIPCPITSVISVSGTGSSANLRDTSFILGTGAGATVVVNVALPAGANSVMVIGGRTPGSSILTPSFNVIISGVESGALYDTVAVVGQNNGSQVVASVVSSAGDQHLRINVSSAAGLFLAGTFRVEASFSTQAVQVQNNGSPLTVTGTGTSGALPTSRPLYRAPSSVLVGAGGATAGNSSVIIPTLSTTSDRFIQSLLYSLLTTVAGSGAGFVSIKGHTSGALQNVLALKSGGVNTSPIAAALDGVFDVQTFLTPGTDAQYDLLHNANGIASDATISVITSNVYP